MPRCDKKGALPQMTNRRISMCVRWMATAAALAAAQAVWCADVKEESAGDIIRRQDGSELEGVQILQDNYIEVKYKTHRMTASMRAFDVKEIEYADATTKDDYYLKAMYNIRKGRWSKAVERLREALEKDQIDKKTRRVGKEPWGKEYAYFWLGYCEYETGEYAKAREHLAMAIEANPKSRFLFEAMSRIALCYAEEKNFAEAEKALDAARKRFQEYKDEVKNISVDYSKFADRQLALCELTRAKMLLRRADAEFKERGKGDYDRVRSVAQSVITMCMLDNQDIQAEAKELIREALIGMQRFDEVLAYCKRIVEDYKRSLNPDLQAGLPGAYIGMGDALFGIALQREAEGILEGEQGSRFKFAEARDKYLRVIVEYFDNQEFLAKANYMAGICCKRLKDVEKDAMERAIRHWKTVVEEFPDSAFKQKAEEELAAASAGVQKTDSSPAKADAAPGKAGDATPKTPASTKTGSGPAAKTEDKKADVDLP